MNTLSILILIIFFLFCSAFFSATEAALTSISKYRIKRIINKKTEKIFSIWLNYPQNILTSILVGNTIANILLSAFLVIFFLNLFPFVNRRVIEIFSWVFGVFLLLILAEITPKIYSRSNPEKISLLSIKPISIFSKLLQPIIYPLLFLVNRIFGFKEYPVTSSKISSIEEIREVILHSSDEVSIKEETKLMLDKVLKLNLIKVSDIMTKDIDKIELKKEKNNIVDKIIQFGRSRIPIFDNNQPKGYIMSRDLVVKLINKEENFDDIIKPIYIVDIDKKVNELLSDFQKLRTHICLVKDKSNKIIGLVTLEDIIEETIGEILDEYDLERNVNRNLC